MNSKKDNLVFPNLDEAAVKTEVSEALRSAGMEESYIYAWEKTGMLVTPFNLDGWSEEDLDEFHSAISEYNKKNGIEEA